VLEGAGLGCERGGRQLFRALSFSLAAGEALRISGANGRGKTSLLKILCGLLQPQAGEVRWKGEAIGSLREDYSSQLVYLGHASAVKDEFTAFENLMFTWVIAGKGMPVPADSLMHALSTLKVPMNAPVKKLSQGQRRRVLLARLALSEAQPLWLLDEPFAALDADAVRIVEDLVAAHVKRGGIVVYTSHQESRVPGRELVLDV
jgi:heme exporter protein A